MSFVWTRRNTLTSLSSLHTVEADLVRLRAYLHTFRSSYSVCVVTVFVLYSVYPLGRVKRKKMRKAAGGGGDDDEDED